MPQCFQPPGPLSQASPEHGNQRPLGRVTVELLVVSLLFVAVCGCLLAAGWGKWGEFLIDYGREISIPWRIVRGEMLYRDISFAYGPLSPYTQALLFALFGPSLTVVLVADAAILGLILLAAAWLVFLVTDVTVAVCAAMVLVVISGLNHMMGIAIFNLLTPYSHALTYGLALSLASLVVLTDHVRRPTSGKALGIGLLAGLVLLTKPEVCVGLAGALAVGGVLLFRGPACPVARTLRHLGFFSLGLLVPSLVAFGALASVSSPGQALLFMTRAWGPIFDDRVTNLAFIQKFVFGTRDLHDNLWALCRSLSENALIAAYIFSVGVLAKPFKRRLSVLGPITAVVLTWFLATCFSREDAYRLVVDIPRAWPTLMALALAWLLFRQWRAPRGGPVAPGTMALATLAALALGLCAKIFINATLLHYGAMLLGPAGLVWSMGLLWFVPAMHGNEANARKASFAGALTLVVLFLWPIIALSQEYFASRTERVSTARGTLVLDGRGRFVRELLAWLDREAAPGETLAVLPEGAMLNFLSGHPNPTAYDNILLWDYLIHGEKRIEEDFQAAPPDWIALIHRPTPEYEVGLFCQGYGRGLCQWIADNYDQVALWGAVPNKDNRFGLMLLRHKR